MNNMWISLFFLFFLGTSIGYTQTIESNQVESVFTQAIDARFTGDLAKSRNLLETLKESNFTNEYIMTLLVEVYGEYLVSLVQEKNKSVLEIAYPGIRKNIAEIWDMYPNSSVIQEQGLKIAWLMGDVAMGKALFQLILENDKDHLLANYFGGMYLFIEEDHIGAIPYFKKVAYSSLEQGSEQFIFQSRFYLGDIYLKQNNFSKAMTYYRLAMDIASNIELSAKIAVLETYYMNFQEAYDFFRKVPLQVMTPNLFDAYIATLWGLNTPESIRTMDLLLSQNSRNPIFSQAVIQVRLGRTQKAIQLLKKEQFMKTELPSFYYTFLVDLLERGGYQREASSKKTMLGVFFYQIGELDKSLAYLEPLDRSLDTNGEIALTLGQIAQKKGEFVKAKNYIIESLSKEKDLNRYTVLIELEVEAKNFDSAEQYLEEAIADFETEDVWENLMYAYIRFGQQRFSEAEERLLLVRTIVGEKNILFNHFLASIYIEQNKLDKAELLLEQTLLLDFTDPASLNHLAYLYSIMNKKLDKAEEMVLQALQQSPEDIYYLDTLAWVYFQKKNMVQAEKVFQTIELLLPNQVYSVGFEEIYDHLGAYYKEIGNEELSNKYFNKALVITPNSTYIIKSQQE